MWGGVYRKGFVYSHVLTTYYNWKEKKLLKDKLDDMDALIAQHAEAIASKLVTNTKFNEELAKYVTKAMMVGVDTNDENKVPNAAFIHSLAEKITANENAITTLNSEALKTSVFNDIYDPNAPDDICTYAEKVPSGHPIKIVKSRDSANTPFAMELVSGNDSTTLIIGGSQYITLVCIPIIGNKIFIRNRNRGIWDATWKSISFT